MLAAAAPSSYLTNSAALHPVAASLALNLKSMQKRMQGTAFTDASAAAPPSAAEPAAAAAMRLCIQVLRQAISNSSTDMA